MRGASGSLPRSAGKAAASRTGDKRRTNDALQAAALSPRISAAMLLALLAGGWLSIARGADPAPPPQQLDEIEVSGERTGPGLWHVHHGDAQLWILGSMSPLPKGITWRSKQVEQVLGSTSQVLVQKPFDIGVARIVWLLLTERSLFLLRGGKRLKDVMPADMHTRFAAQRAKYTDDPTKWERFRPLIAAAFLQQAAFHHVGLSTRVDMGAAMHAREESRGAHRGSQDRRGERRAGSTEDHAACDGECLCRGIVGHRRKRSPAAARPREGVGRRQYRAHTATAGACGSGCLPRGARRRPGAGRSDRAHARNLARCLREILAGQGVDHSGRHSHAARTSADFDELREGYQVDAP